MNTMMETQPDYPNRMFTVYSRAHGLHTDPDLGDEFRYVLNQRKQKRDQSFFHPSIAGAFLARLYPATGETEWLDLSKEYMLLGKGANDRIFTLRGLRQGKTDWTTRGLNTLAGEPTYKEMDVRVDDSIISHQTEDGYWFGLNCDRSPALNLTDEMVRWLEEIHQSVGKE